jgi:hypothetical protein
MNAAVFIMKAGNVDKFLKGLPKDAEVLGFSSHVNFSSCYGVKVKHGSLPLVLDCLDTLTIIDVDKENVRTETCCVCKKEQITWGGGFLLACKECAPEFAEHMKEWGTETITTQAFDVSWETINTLTKQAFDWYRTWIGQENKKLESSLRFLHEQQTTDQWKTEPGRSVGGFCVDGTWTVPETKDAGKPNETWRDRPALL